MDIIVTRTRIRGTLPFYEYRALVPAEDIGTDRRALVSCVAAPRVAGRLACVRLAQIIAPDRYFLIPDGRRRALAADIGLLAKRLETAAVRTIFPEMTADLLPVVFLLDSDPGNACTWTSIKDLTAAFDRLAANPSMPTASDLGLAADCARQAA
ncbi:MULTISPECIES: hypothetical protein [Sphingomonadaceae]|uniref:hypothetical protein n=1 Tax=Sphingomonadales TaxID=204457 RepID=UPI00076FF312|nr:hypothetical protein [Sphingobium sp. TKS]AMK23260.1 hypothetical protein K426_11620 [Sphingobium sp. TKS]MCF8709063.1 hypothetical protein [Rhizorhapis sp. SPR117]